MCGTARWLRPSESGGVFTAHDAVTDFFQSPTFHEEADIPAGVTVDFVRLQPPLGDFKFMLQSGT